jgi:hypothetical protein
MGNFLCQTLDDDAAIKVYTDYRQSHLKAIHVGLRGLLLPDLADIVCDYVVDPPFEKVKTYYEQWRFGEPAALSDSAFDWFLTIVRWEMRTLKKLNEPYYPPPLDGLEILPTRTDVAPFLRFTKSNETAYDRETGLWYRTGPPDYDDLWGQCILKNLEFSANVTGITIKGISNRSRPNHHYRDNMLRIATGNWQNITSEEWLGVAKTLRCNKEYFADWAKHFSKLPRAVRDKIRPELFDGRKFPRTIVLDVLGNTSEGN